MGLRTRMAAEAKVSACCRAKVLGKTSPKTRMRMIRIGIGSRKHRTLGKRTMGGNLIMMRKGNWD